MAADRARQRAELDGRPVDAGRALPPATVQQHQQCRQHREGGEPAEDRPHRPHDPELIKAPEAGHHQRGVGGRGADRRHRGAAPDAGQRKMTRLGRLGPAGPVLLVARHQHDRVVDAVADDDRTEERRRRGQIAEGQLRHRERHGRSDGGREPGQRDGAQPAEVQADRQRHDGHADDGDPQDVALDGGAGGDSGGDGPRHVGAHLGVVALGGILGDEAVGRFIERLAGVLDEEAARGQRRDPDVLAVVAGEDAAREALVEPVVPLQALLHLVDRLFVLERHEERVLALADLVAQPIADRFEVVLRDEEPLVPLIKVA